MKRALSRLKLTSNEIRIETILLSAGTAPCCPWSPLTTGLIRVWVYPKTNKLRTKVPRLTLPILSSCLAILDSGTHKRIAWRITLPPGSLICGSLCLAVTRLMPRGHFLVGVIYRVCVWVRARAPFSNGIHLHACVSGYECMHKCVNLSGREYTCHPCILINT